MAGGISVNGDPNKLYWFDNRILNLTSGCALFDNTKLLPYSSLKLNEIYNIKTFRDSIILDTMGVEAYDTYDSIVCNY